MSSGDKTWETQKWQMMQKRLGYTDDEMKLFRDNPRNEDILSKVPGLMNKTIIAEVVESHGCDAPGIKLCASRLWAARPSASSAEPPARPVTERPLLADKPRLSPGR